MQPSAEGGGEASSGNGDGSLNSDMADLQSKVEEDKGKLALYAGTVTLLEKIYEQKKSEQCTMFHTCNKY